MARDIATLLISRRRLAILAAASAFPANGWGQENMAHVVLLGDSIFDNAAYVGAGDPDVVRQLRIVLPGGWRATLNAVDGARMGDINGQLARVARDASHLVVSIGGNDALLEAGVIEERTNSVAAALDTLAAVRERFRQGYREMLASVLARKLPTAVCTIYEARFPDPNLRRRAAAALMLINDAITREAFASGVTLIDLRLICDSDLDFANPIEPSAHGGAKIARAVAQFAVGGPSQAHVIAR
jgi:GDSL-like Lipase/Acylhydrolase family